MMATLVYHSDQSRKTMLALAKGISACGDIALLADGAIDQDVAEGEVLVKWGSRIDVDLPGTPILYLEAGYINGSGPDYVENRLRFVSAEWNGLGDLADPLSLPTGDWPTDRWDALEIELQPYRDPGPNLLVLEQHPSDGAANPKALGDAIPKDGAYHIKRRQHPLVSRSGPLNDDLEWADCAITYGSTAAVEAVIAGVRTVTLSPRCVARSVTGRTLSELRELPDRAPWAHRLAYRQWTHDELASGEAWEHLRGRLNASTS